MGAAQSTSTFHEVFPEAGPSSAPEPKETVLEQLKALPQLTSSVQPCSDSMWEDLRRLPLIAQDPERLAMKEDLLHLWECLCRWGEVQAQVVSTEQDSIHTLLEEVGALAERVEERVEAEKEKQAKLKRNLAALGGIKEKAQELERQLSQFNERLYKL